MRRARGIVTLLGLSLALTLTACSAGSNEATEAATESAATATVQPSEAAPSASVPNETAGSQEPGSKGFLWRVSGGANPGYLVGTIHVAREEMYPLDPDLEQAVTEADYIGLELDLTKVDQLALAALVTEKALLTDGTTLKDHVSEEDYETFKAAMKKSLGIVGASAFDKYEPWYAAMTLESLPAMKYQQTDGIDLHLAKQAHDNGKTVIELESAEGQLGIFDTFTEELQRLYFHQTVQGAALASIGYKQLLDMWTLGDLKILEQMHESYLKEGKKTMGDSFDEFDDAFLVARNEGMVEKIDESLRGGDAGTYLFAVGSLHMVGEHGLVDELERLGYELEYIE
ncbi:TraB/GumN family protein [Cohnella sp. GCM10027633]|uniref:TraB/GumN family protein n=1 Tax=unclassified Cohnella TaxID=2636738 RepID=UPI003631AFFC